MTGTPVPDAVLAAAGDAVRAYLRMPAGAEAPVLAQAVAAAFGTAEAFCGALLVARAADDGLPAGWADLPGPVAQAIVLLAARLVEHREDDAPMPAAATALLRPFRVVRLLADAAS